MTEEYSVGARWWRVDFHAHSPLSYDFGAAEGSISSNRPTVDDWLRAYMTSEIDALVITDHNSHEGIDKARAGLAALRKQNDEGFRELHLFPGVEITTPGGIHLLAVFDPAVDSDTVNGLLHQCRFLGKRGTSSHTTEKSFTEVVRLIAEVGGIAIPAHVDTSAGLLSMASNELAGLERENLIGVVEFTGEDTSSLAGRDWIPILGSDAHHLDASGAPDGVTAKFPGSHFTWVKMSTPNLAGLRAAFSDGPASLIRSVSSSTDPNKIDHSAIRSIRIKSGEVEYRYEFGHWMNALIGGRGTGKSTLIEVLRLAMDRFRELPEAVRSDLAWFSPENPRGQSARIWDSSTEVEVEYARPTGLYRIIWSGLDPETRQIQVRVGSEWVAEEGAVFERFPVLISSQKQIFELSKDPQALLSLVDSLPEVDHASWSRANEELRASYRTLRSSIAGVRQQLADESTLRGNLIDAEELVESLRSIRDSPNAKELDRLVAEQREQAEHDEAVFKLSVEIHSAIELFDATVENKPASDAASALEKEWREFVARSASEIRATDLALSAGLDSYRSGRDLDDPRNEEIGRLRDILNPRVDAAEVSNVSVQSAEEVSVPGGAAAQLDPYEGAVQRRDELQRSVASLDWAKTEVSILEAQAATVLTQVSESRTDIFHRRQRALSNLSGTTIELKLFPFADTTQFEIDLRSVTQRPNGFDIIFEREGLRRVLVNDSRHPAYQTELNSLKTVLKELRQDGESPTLLAVPGRAVDQRFISHIQALDEFEYEVAVDLWYPEDHLEVRYSDSPGQARRPINLGSPGQRTAALLAVMLRLGDQPLLLDQPEDDIDNLLIYELVVKTLKEAKSRRQVIIATHNANIVVNGDAEYVTILENDSLPRIVSSGAIQDDSVRDLICRVMEGGQTAFQARYRRLLRD